MKWVHKETGKVFYADNPNLFSMLKREGYEPAEEEKKKAKTDK